MNVFHVGLVVALLSGIFFGAGCLDTASEQKTVLVTVVIKYKGSWTGSVGTESSSNSVNGHRDKEYDLKGTIFSAVIQKEDNTTAALKLYIKRDGQNVEFGETSTPYGIVTVSYSVL